MATVPQIEPTSQVEVANLTTAIIAHERQHTTGLFEPDGDQHAPRVRQLAGSLDRGPWPRADVRMDWQFHSWDRLLFSTCT